MDTKWKRWKRIISFTVFMAGVSLLLYGAFGTAGLFLNYGSYDGGRKRELLERDYQNTQRFRDYIGGRLEDFIVMAAGGPLWEYYWYGGVSDTGNMWETVLEADSIAQEGGAVEEGLPYRDIYGGGQGDSQARKEDNKKAADRLHSYLEKDKNMLYTIAYDGQILYTNTDGLVLDGQAGVMPEGYNFLLYFDGSRVTALKDGIALDIYGDGYYREGDDWYVPGYQNITVDEEMAGAEITIVAAAEPLLYSYSNYGQGGYLSAESRLYRIQSQLQHFRGRLLACIGCLAGGILLLLCYPALRKSKKEADRAIAGLTGRVFMECKAAAVLLILWGTALLNPGVHTVIHTETITSAVYEDIGVVSGYTAMAGGQRLWEVLSDLTQEPGRCVILFWIVYAAVLDLRGNKCVWKKSLLYKLIDVFRARGLRLPLAKRLIRRNIPVSVLSAGFVIAVGIGLFACIGYDNTHRPGLLALLIIVGALGMAAALCLHISGDRRLAGDMELLAGRISQIHKGEYGGGCALAEDSELRELSAQLEDIRQGMAHAIEEQVKSQRMKVELVANVSHDIKTPLTSIISYVEFLKQEEGLPTHVRDYILILDEKAQRLKNMVQDVFSVSQAASGQLSVNIEALDFGKLLRQTMADMEGQIQESSVTVRADIPEEPVMIRADGQRMYRVFQNLIQNALKYSLEGSRVYITLFCDDSTAAASVKNTSKSELKTDKDFTERFVRGDESRTDGGSGLGLSIARSFTEACGGMFRLEVIADLFVATVSFSRIE